MPLRLTAGLLLLAAVSAQPAHARSQASPQTARLLYAAVRLLETETVRTALATLPASEEAGVWAKLLGLAAVPPHALAADCAAAGSGPATAAGKSAPLPVAHSCPVRGPRAP